MERMTRTMTGLTTGLERLVEVNALLLRETMKHPACFVAIERAIELQLVAKEPFAKENVGILRTSLVSLLRRARYSSVIASSQLGSLSTACAEEGNRRVRVDRSM
jgi:hypothetical protein